MLTGISAMIWSHYLPLNENSSYTLLSLIGFLNLVFSTEGKPVFSRGPHDTVVVNVYPEICNCRLPPNKLFQNAGGPGLQCSCYLRACGTDSRVLSPTHPVHPRPGAHRATLWKMEHLTTWLSNKVLGFRTEAHFWWWFIFRRVCRWPFKCWSCCRTMCTITFKELNFTLSYYFIKQKKSLLVSWQVRNIQCLIRSEVLVHYVVFLFWADWVWLHAS
jgi:hypothetical protein